tara:strand:- start:2715 stop:3026 length:312 start_codon:yes stop_codon:yes gene_type:complete
MSYRPLPDEVEIRDSGIEGKGLFAKVIIEEGTNLGMTHVTNSDFEDGRIRTPLGGFINHSDNPNCELIGIGKYYYLITLKDLMPDEEITLRYSLYSVKRTASV